MPYPPLRPDHFSWRQVMTPMQQSGKPSRAHARRHDGCTGRRPSIEWKNPSRSCVARHSPPRLRHSRDRNTSAYVAATPSMKRCDAAIESYRRQRRPGARNQRCGSATDRSPRSWLCDLPQPNLAINSGPPGNRTIGTGRSWRLLASLDTRRAALRERGHPSFTGLRQNW